MSKVKGDSLCECLHLNRWHRDGTCRILDCECERFRAKPIIASADGSWMQSGKPSRARRVAAAHPVRDSR